MRSKETGAGRGDGVKEACFISLLGQDILGWCKHNCGFGINFTSSQLGSDKSLLIKIGIITLTKKIHLVKAIVFPIVMYGCESLTTKKTEHRRIDAFELWCWRRVFRVP